MHKGCDLGYGFRIQRKFGAVYSVKNNGPRTEHWRVWNEAGSAVEKQLFIITA